MFKLDFTGKFRLKTKLSLKKVKDLVQMLLDLFIYKSGTVAFGVAVFY